MNTTSLFLLLSSHLIARRCTSEDLAFMVLSLVNAYVAPVPAVQGLGKKTGLKTFACILGKCRYVCNRTQHPHADSVAQVALA